MRSPTSFKVAQPDSTAGRRSPGAYADLSRNTEVGSTGAPSVKVTARGLLGRAYIVLLMTPVFWILLFIFADTISRDSMWALPEKVDFLLTAAVLAAFSVPTIAVVALALMAWSRERSWLAYPVTLAFGLQVWVATQVQSPVLLFITVGVGLVVLLVAGVRQRYLRRKRGLPRRGTLPSSRDDLEEQSDGAVRGGP